ncbi:MAG: hypothetical protein EHM64_04030 [Ignavibacteriae bacterium]|nr:MAG: hypothetical protein EHM64_04030 [Ignavibacteriota bacterium]
MRYALVIIAAVLLSSTGGAQLSINLNFNVDRQPVWGPTGYDHVENYYLPDIEVYYNVPQHMYYYQNKGRWMSSSSLPSRYRGFDLYNSHKVVINERTPWRKHAAYRDQYVSFKGRHDQQPIRDARDSKYYVNPNHPEHNNWVKQQKHDNGNGKGKGNNKNKGNGRGNK